MYLISIYFDEHTNRKIQGYVERVASATGNTFMIDGQIPPHMTIAVVETRDQDLLLQTLENKQDKLLNGKIHFVSLGAFLPHVIYIEPVLDAFLQELSTSVHGILDVLPGIRKSHFYQPFSWLPHVSIGKHLDEQQMQTAFQILQKEFTPFYGQVIKIGVAKTNPHRDLMVWEL